MLWLAALGAIVIVSACVVAVALVQTLDEMDHGAWRE